MYEIAATLDAVDLPNGLHIGAAQIYEQLAEFKDGAPNTAEVLAQLASTEDKPID